VYGVRHHVFAGSTFTQHQNGRRLAGRYPADKVPDFPRILGNADNPIHAEFAALQLLRALDLCPQASGFEGIVNGIFELLKVNGFFDEVIGSKFQTSNGVIDDAECRDHNNGDLDVPVSQFRKHFDSGHIRKLDIERNQIGIVELDSAERRCSIFGQTDMVSPLLQFLLQRPAHKSFVIHHQNCFLRHRRSTLQLPIRQKTGRRERHPFPLKFDSLSSPIQERALQT